MSEKSSFVGLNGTTRTSYGSTRGQYPPAADRQGAIEHELEPGDNLARLSLKYGVTVEDIKRVNKLFTNESIFVKKTVLIPRSKESLSHSGSPFSVRRPPETATSEERLDASTFLATIDRQVEETKKAVSRLEESGSKLVEAIEASESNRQHSSSSANASPSPAHQNDKVIKVTNHGLVSHRKVKKALQQQTDDDDELFEL